MRQLPSQEEKHSSLRSFARSILDLWLESPCRLCQRSTATVLCQNCQQRLQHCQLAPSRQLSCHQGVTVFAWGAYQGSLKRAIAALKYSRQPELAEPLGHALGQAWLTSPLAARPAGSRQPLVIPIPLHASKMQQRGYNQALLLAEHFCRTARLPLERYGLKRIRATEAQFGLSATARSQNLAQAFQVEPEFLKIGRHRPVLLLDDIYTTGATIQAAKQVLQQQGISVLGTVAIARSFLGGQQ